MYVTVIFITAAMLFTNIEYAECKQSVFQDNYTYAVKLMNLNKYDAAAIEFKGLLTKAENKEWASTLLYMIGQCYYKLGNLQESKIYLDRVNKNYPDSKFIIFVKEMLNDIKLKLPEEQQKIDSSAENTNSDEANTDKQKNDQSVNIIINHQNNTIVKDNKAEIELNSEEISKINKIDKLIKEGNDYFNNNNFEKALESYKSAFDLDSDNSVIKFNIGVTQMKLGNYIEANSMIEDVYKKNPEDVEALKYVAYTYLKLDKPVLSLIYWKRLLRLMPNDELANSNIKKIEKMVDMK